MYKGIFLLEAWKGKRMSSGDLCADKTGDFIGKGCWNSESQDEVSREDEFNFLDSHGSSQLTMPEFGPI